MRYAMLSAMVCVGVCVAAAQAAAQVKIDVRVREGVATSCTKQEDAIALLETTKAVDYAAAAVQFEQFRAEGRCQQGPVEGRAVARVHDIDGVVTGTFLSTGKVFQVDSGGKGSPVTTVYIVAFEPIHNY